MVQKVHLKKKLNHKNVTQNRVILAVLGTFTEDISRIIRLIKKKRFFNSYLSLQLSYILSPIVYNIFAKLCFLVQKT